MPTLPPRAKWVAPQRETLPDKATQKAIKRLSNSEATERLLRVAASALEESGEELLGGVTAPPLQSLYNGKSVAQNYRDMKPGEILYDALIGGILGAAGGSVDVTRDAVRANPPRSVTREIPLRTAPRDGRMETREIKTEVVRNGDQQGKQTFQDVKQKGTIRYAKQGEVSVIGDFDHNAYEKRIDNAAKQYDLLDDETEFLIRYVAGTAYDLTYTQRNTPESEWSEYDRTAMDATANALRKFPIFSGRTYRNLQFGRPNEPKNAYRKFLDEYREGNVVSLKAFSSSSKDPNGYPVHGKAVHLVIDGKSGRDIADTFGIPSQQEVVYLPGTRLLILKRTTANDGKPLIFAQEVEGYGKDMERDSEN